MMKKLKQFVPNLLTLGNLFCGCLAIYCLFSFGNGEPIFLFNLSTIESVIFLIFISLILDFFDGFVARLLNAKTLIGSQLDSLADLVSFGVLPGFLLLSTQIFPDGMVAFLIPLAAAYRLAKFNVDEEQTTYFKGLATPAATLFVIGIVSMNMSNPGFRELILSPFIFFGIIVLICYLMISNIPLFSLKVNSLGWKDNWYRYVLLLGSIAALVCLGLSAFVFIIPAYIVLSVVVKRHFV